jgi:regulator of protease activity HflC (stomatin/prohibitin superfamily)
MHGFDIFVIILVGLFFVLAASIVKIVPQGFNYTVERLGRYTHTLEPGLAILLPFIDSVGKKVNMMEQVLDVPSQEVITRDNAMVQVDGVAFFQVLEIGRASCRERVS